ncbi:hypothetical protein AQUCO_10500018v1 [Aquilegia coerulea]|uniref:Uncharacterized protein n=1 Tax=Aquilegia coerulea TaxID=218851 RepID=A0A2G5C3Q2_AQUCA|nr:hypothetical protein AQUCO_10500018v1 [Aquilegia coerulea]
MCEKYENLMGYGDLQLEFTIFSSSYDSDLVTVVSFYVTYEKADLNCFMGLQFSMDLFFVVLVPSLQ